MATTLPKMSLIRWDQTTDNFDHAALAQNFTNIDQHDHSSGKGVQIPTAGIANQAVNTPQITDGAITDSKVSTTSPITDGKLASPNNSAFRVISSASAKITNSNSVGTYLLGSGSTLVPPTTSTANIVPTYWLDPADYQVSAKSTMLQILVGLFVNAVAPNITYTVALNPISIDNGSSSVNNIGYAIGSSVTSSSVDITTPAQYSENEAITNDFVFPVAGFYAFTLHISGSPASGSISAIHTQLRVHYT